MKVVLFEISEIYKAVQLKYRSGDPLSISELDLLATYVADLRAQMKAMEPRKEPRI